MLIFSASQVAMSLQTAAETSSPIGPLLAELVTTSSPNDPTSFVSHKREEEEELVRALVSSMPARVLANGVATRQQLEERFASMKGNLGLLALLPSSGGTDEMDVGSGGRDAKASSGVLSYLVASLASRLKVSERSCCTLCVLQVAGCNDCLCELHASTLTQETVSKDLSNTDLP